MVFTKVIQKWVTWAPANHFKNVMKKASVILAEDGRCDVEMEVKEEHMNAGGNLHSGLSGVLIDVISCCAFMTHPKLAHNLKARNAVVLSTISLHMSFHGSIKVGDEILVQSNVVETNGALGFIETSICNKKTRDLLVRGQLTARSDLLARQKLKSDS